MQDKRDSTLGIYPGTFNPFHKGHQNVLDKARKIFDEVLVAVGINHDKGDDHPHLSFPYPPYTPLLYYDEYTTNLVVHYRADYKSVTIVRGIRNSTDYAYEMNNLAFMRELLPDVEMILIPCDKQYEHLSSSALRKLSKFGDEFKHHIITPKS